MSIPLKATSLRHIVQSVICLTILWLLGSSIGATIINVPADFTNIQEAINTAVTGDTVLVAPGVYQENIMINGKDLMVSSHYLLDQNFDHIYATIIDGSNQSHPDTGSTVIIRNCPGVTTVLQGFTITGGTGTRHEWAAGNFDKMGGGVFLYACAATVKYNCIRDNHMVREPGLHAVGGAGIKSSGAYAWIENNIITDNGAEYGAGVALDLYSTTYLTNNVIAYNHGGEVYGGSGIQINQGTTHIENNTIVGNVSVQPGAGIRAFGGVQTVRNNVIWYNEAPSSPQIYNIDVLFYCNVQGGIAPGTGNISAEPHLSPDIYLCPYGDSPCIDAGDPSSTYDDVENPAVPGTAHWPAFGGLRNDIGAYGGPGGFPLQLAGLYADTTQGWFSLDVSFEAHSRVPCDEWTWQFGDGESAVGQTTSHLYDEPGVYDVTVTMQAGEDSYIVSRQNLIVVLADTLKADTTIGYLIDTAEVTISATNNAPVDRIVIPVAYSGDCDLSLISCSVEGCRTEGFDIDTLDLDEINQRCVLALQAGEGQVLGAGAGSILKLFMAPTTSCPPGVRLALALDGYDSWTPRFEGPVVEYDVPTVGGEIALYCCGQYTGGITGNANCSDDGKITLSDISRLIDRVFVSKEPLCCEASGNTNNSEDCKITLSDISTLIDAVFISKVDPADCMSACEQ